MLPSLFVHEYLMIECHHEQQREMAELRMLAGLRQHHIGCKGVSRTASKLCTSRAIRRRPR